MWHLTSLDKVSDPLHGLKKLAMEIETSVTETSHKQVSTDTHNILIERHGGVVENL